MNIEYAMGIIVIVNLLLVLGYVFYGILLRQIVNSHQATVSVMSCLTPRSTCRCCAL